MELTSNNERLKRLNLMGIEKFREMKRNKIWVSIRVIYDERNENMCSLPGGGMKIQEAASRCTHVEGHAMMHMHYAMLCIFYIS